MLTMEERPYLPREVVRHIASFVSLEHLNVLFAACRSWRQWLEEAGIWEAALETQQRCPWGQLAPPQLKRMFPAIGAPRFNGQRGICRPSWIRDNLTVLKGARSRGAPDRARPRCAHGAIHAPQTPLSGV